MGHPTRLVGTAPGRDAGLGFRWASLCETPDLDLLPARFGVRGEALFFAGLELAVMHLGLTALCRLVRWRLVRSLVPLAGMLRAAARLVTPWGRDRGGMVVEAEGRDERGRPIRARWALWAEAGIGPHTPAAPAGRHRPQAARRHGGRARARLRLRGPASPRGDPRRACGPAHPHPDGRKPPGRSRAVPQAARPALRTNCPRASAPSTTGGTAPASRDRRSCAPAGASRRAVFAASCACRAAGNAISKSASPLRGRTRSGRAASGRAVSPRASRRRAPRRVRGAVRAAAVSVPAGRLGARRRLDAGRLAPGEPSPSRALAPQIRAGAGERGGRYRFRIVVAHAWTGLLFAYRGWLA